MEAKHVLFDFFGSPVTLYGLLIALSFFLGLTLFYARRKEWGLKKETAEIFALFTLPLGFLGARFFYCLARLPLYQEIGLWNMLRFWDGGYALWGAFGGAVLASVLTAKHTKQSTKTVLDALAAPAALVIALCRFAEYFSGEGIGMYVENEFFWRFPFAVCNEWEEWYWAVFLLEGVAALAICCLVFRRKSGKPGDNAKLFTLLYCASQVLLESLRRDNFLRWLFVRVSQLTAVLVMTGLMIAAVIAWAKLPREKRMAKMKLILFWALYVICTGLCIGLEFAIDKSADLPVWLCYCLMAVCCAGLGTSAYQIVLKKEKA